MKKGHPWRLLKVAKDGNKELDYLLPNVWKFLCGTTDESFALSSMLF